MGVSNPSALLVSAALIIRTLSSMVTFLVATVQLSLVSTSSSEKVILLIAWVILALLIFSTIYANWEKSSDPARYIFRRIVEYFIKGVKAEAQELHELCENPHGRAEKAFKKRFKFGKKFKRLRSSPPSILEKEE